MQAIKYPIKEVEIKTIPKNRKLSLSITQIQKALCEKSIRQYGLLTPIVLMENTSGELMTMAGENELEILKEMNVAKADVFIAKLKDHSDACKVILLLSALQRGLNALSEGLILRELMKTGSYTQRELAENLMKSESWISKRLSLAEQLNENVVQMVLAKQLFPASAQEISRLPKEVQHRFAMEVYVQNIPKSTVERLITAHNSKTTPEALKQEIINHPVLAANALSQAKVEKCAKNNDAKKDISSKFEATIRLLLKLVAEVEMYLASITAEEIKKHNHIFALACSSMCRFIKLVEQLSPRKVKGDAFNAEN